MSDHVIPPPEHTPGPAPGVDPEQVRQDLAAVAELAAAGVEVEGEVQVAESTWVVYGHTSYDGEVPVGVYHDAVEASAVVHTAGHPPPSCTASTASSGPPAGWPTPRPPSSTPRVVRRSVTAARHNPTNPRPTKGTS